MTPCGWRIPALFSAAVHGTVLLLAVGLFGGAPAPATDPAIAVELIVAETPATEAALAEIAAETFDPAPSAPTEAEAPIASPQPQQSARPAPEPPPPKRRPSVTPHPNAAPDAVNSEPATEETVATLAALGSDRIESKLPSVERGAPTPSGASEARPQAGNAPPEYPPLARRNGTEGRVVVRVAVGITGAADKVNVVRSSGAAALDDAALSAVARWRFEPARLAGVPIAASLDVPIVFRLESR